MPKRACWADQCDSGEEMCIGVEESATVLRSSSLDSLCTNMSWDEPRHTISAPSCVPQTSMVHSVAPAPSLQCQLQPVGDVFVPRGAWMVVPVAPFAPVGASHGAFQAQANGEIPFVRSNSDSVDCAWMQSETILPRPESSRYGKKSVQPPRCRFQPRGSYSVIKHSTKQAGRWTREEGRQSVGHMELEAPSVLTPNADEEEWERRVQKRLAAVATIKDTDEYLKCLADRKGRRNGCAVPRTPSPNRRSLSKRQWEAELGSWRVAIRQWNLHNVGDMSR